MNEKLEELDRLLAEYVPTEQDAEFARKAKGQQAQFVARFPVGKLGELTPETYCIGRGDRENFCWWVERGTNALSHYSPGSSKSYGMFWQKKTQSYRMFGVVRKYQEDHPDVDAAEALRVMVAEPLKSFVEQKGENGTFEDVRSVGRSFLLKLLILYYPEEFMQVNSTGWIDRILDAYELEKPESYVDRNRVLRRLYEEKKGLVQGGKLTEGAFVGVVARQLGLGRKQQDEEENVVGVENEAGDASGYYSEEDFLRDVFMTEAQYRQLAALLRKKKNLILTGAPGVGKTFAAKRLAWAMMGGKYADRVAFVQFHQSYSYEDFVCGYRPTDDGGFALSDGVFSRFCRRAAADPEKTYFLIIDEINRGNVSKIFGELLMAIEADKRGCPEYAVRLAYRPDEEFVVPENLHIIGMMNTADRSLAMMDYALRRRFSFYQIEPGFESDGFKALLEERPEMRRLVDCVRGLNGRIAEDPSFGKGFAIGHSYFCGDSTPEEIVRFDLIPTLEEYWYDDPAKAGEETGRLLEAIR